MILLLVTLLILSIGLVVFAIYNPGSVVVSLPFYSREISTALLVALAAALGALVVGAVSAMKFVSLRMALWQSQGKIRELEKELQKVRPQLPDENRDIGDLLQGPRSQDKSRGSVPDAES